MGSRGRGRGDKSRTIPFRPPGRHLLSLFAQSMSLVDRRTWPLFAPLCSADKLQSRFPPNIVRNQKYNIFTFIPVVLYEQFKFFFNLYFLLVALSQFIPALKIGAPIRTSPFHCSSCVLTLFRFYNHVCCTTRFRPVRHNGKRSIR